MTNHLPTDLLDPNGRHSGTPADLVIRTEARKPATKPTLDVDVPVVAPSPPSKHRLVTLGDSLSMGFQSLGTANTAICWPRIVAWELGLDDRDFVTPTLSRFGGMPLNLEFLLRELESHVDDLGSVTDVLRAAFFGLGFSNEVARFWGNEWDRNISPQRVHNLASWGWDIADLQQVSASSLRRQVEEVPFYPSSAAARSAYRVLYSARRPGEKEGTLTPVEAAHAFGEDGGIETLVVMIGANNALRSVIDLKAKWTDDSGAHRDQHGKQAFTVWHPKHFGEELERLVTSLASIKAQNVIVSTVPHVTVPPVTRGVTPGSPGSKVTATSRYFEFYTRPWAEKFDYRDDPCLTAGQARAIDSAIDDYNDAIESAVRRKRSEGKQWFLLETAGLLDRLASRRYLEHPAARPSWWDSVGGAYPLPEPLARLGVDSRFFLADANGRTQGGLFSLDGVHPTTIGYGLIAQEVMNVMHLAGVKFQLGNGALRPGPVAVDFERLLRLDTLMAAPPRLSAGLLTLLRTLDERSEGVLQRLGVVL